MASGQSKSAYVSLEKTKKWREMLTRRIRNLLMEITDNVCSGYSQGGHWLLQILVVIVPAPLRNPGALWREFSIAPSETSAV